jgi:hypothetical protein
MRGDVRLAAPSKLVAEAHGELEPAGAATTTRRRRIYTAVLLVEPDVCQKLVDEVN